MSTSTLIQLGPVLHIITQCKGRTAYIATGTGWRLLKKPPSDSFFSY